MWSDVRSEGGVWEVLAAFCDEPMRQLVPLNRSWAALARDDESALCSAWALPLPGAPSPSGANPTAGESIAIVAGGGMSYMAKDGPER